MLNIVWLRSFQYNSIANNTLLNPRNEKSVIFYLLTPCLDEILEQDQSLVDVPPVLAVIVEPLPDHLHDLGEGDHVVC